MNYYKLGETGNEVQALLEHARTNLLHNADFRNPVQLTAGKVNRWTGEYTVGADSVTTGSIRQTFPPEVIITGRTYMLSAEIDGEIWTACVSATESGESVTVDVLAETVLTLGYEDGGYYFEVTSTDTVEVTRCKVEQNTVSTLKNDPPEDYGRNLILCTFYDDSGTASIDLARQVLDIVLHDELTQKETESIDRDNVLQAQIDNRSTLDHKHSTDDLTDGVLPLERGGTNATDADSARTKLGAAPISSPTFRDAAYCPTAAEGSSNTHIANTEFVMREVKKIEVSESTDGDGSGGGGTCACGELEDYAFQFGSITNAGAGWNSYTFPLAFEEIPAVVVTPINFNGYVQVQNITKTGFQYCLREVVLQGGSSGSVSTGTYYTADGTAATVTHTGCTLVSGVTLPTLHSACTRTTSTAVSLKYLAIEYGGDE